MTDFSDSAPGLQGLARRYRPFLARSGAAATAPWPATPLYGPHRIGGPAVLAAPGLQVFVLFFALTLLLRAPWLGDPLFHTDEQFYLLVGDRMWHGLLPYVDIWDRKPLGLFLIFGAARALPGDGVLAYQLMAMASAAATATVIACTAVRIAGKTGALLAGFAYLLYLPVFNCGMGQAPVFYNLPMMLAASRVLATLADVDALGRDGGHEAQAGDDLTGPRLLRSGLWAMLFVGIAIQIKTSVVVEGMGFGLLLLWAGWRTGWSHRQLGMAATVWIGAALLPTLLALAVYAALGHAGAFITANFLSIFGRGQDLSESAVRLAKVLAVLVPFYFAIWRGRGRTAGAPVLRQALVLWLVFAFIGLLVPGSWYDHYAAPMLMPLALLSAPALDGLRRGCRIARGFLVLVGTVASMGATAAQAHRFGDAADLDRAVDAIEPLVDARHCLWVYEGDSALYRATQSCLPGRFVFPAHLSTRFEDAALGTDSVTEVRRILANAPGAVVIDESGDPYAPNLRTRTVVLAALGQDYVRIGPLMLGTRRFGLYARKPMRVD